LAGTTQRRGSTTRGWGHFRPSLRPLPGPDQAVIPSAPLVAVLAVDFLQAEHVSGDALQLRAHDRDTRRQRWLLVGHVVKVLKVERRDPHGCPSRSALPSRLVEFGREIPLFSI